MLAARLRAYVPGGDPLQQMSEPVSWSAMVARNDVGSLTLTYSSVAAGGEIVERALTDGVEIAVELSKGDVDAFGFPVWVEPRGCRFVLIDRDRDIADPTKSLSLTLPSYAWILAAARNYTTDVYPPEHAQAGKRGWTDPTTGEILVDLLAENTARGGYASQVAPVFTAAADAAGTPWPVIESQAFDIGTDYASILDALTAAGVLDWTTQNRGLYAYLPDAVALSPDLATGDAPVTLHPKHVAAMPTRESIATLAGRMFVRTDAGGVAIATDPAVTGPWGIPEGFLQVGSVADQAAAVAVGEAEIERTGHERGQYTRDLVLTPDAPAPLLDYWPGAWIKAPGRAGALERLRVQSVTLTRDADGLGGSAVLNDRILDDEERRARNLAALAGSGTVSPGGPPAAVDPEASRVPSTPTGLDTTAVVGFVGGVPRGTVTATWNAVTTATDTGALTISAYELQWRIGASGPWQTIVTPELSAQIPDLTPGDAVGARVRAVGARTTLPSAWSAIDTVTVPGDVTPPPVPTVPTISSAFRVASVTWAGTLAAAIPPDFARVEVALGPTSTPTTIVGILTRGGTLQVPGQTIGQTVWARLRSVDTTGNTSAFSAAVSVVVAGVKGPDLEANSVTANSIAAGAIDGQIITGATIRTAASGARVEMNSTGLFAYDAGGVETVSILGASATITGATIRTAAGSDRLEMSGTSLKGYVGGNIGLQLDPNGLSAYDSTGALKFRLSAYTGAGTMTFVDFLQALNIKTDGIEVYTGSDSTGVGASVGYLTYESFTDAYLMFSNNRNIDIRTLSAGRSIRVRGSSTGSASLEAGTVDLIADGTRRLTVTPAGSVGLDNLLTATSAAATVGLGAVSGAMYPLRRITSSRKYKQDVEPHVIDLAALLTLEPRSWRDKAEVEENPNTTRRHVGLIAEEVHAAGLTEFVQYDAGGGPDGFNYDRFAAVGLLAAIKDLNRRVTALETA